jgi:hypothetical protein
MAKTKNAEFPADVIKNWLRTRFTIEFIGIWEQINNPNFKLVVFNQFKNEAGDRTFVMSPDKWIKYTNAIGLRSKSGRYGGGTFAHRDIAFEFVSWLSPEFKLYLIKEFQRLKEQEKTTIYSLEWQIKRSLSKNNYHIHTDAIAKNLIVSDSPEFQKSLVYANEADMLNLVLFGQTAKEWEEKNSVDAKRGLNMRDVADITELIILSNLETLNANFITDGLDKVSRAKRLLRIANDQKLVLAKSASVQGLRSLSVGSLGKK